MTDLKPFQQATVAVVLAAFRSRRRVRRFLVADEVGLGKTVVAQHVIRALMDCLDRPLVVFYMCSNLAIARQNRRKLLEVLPKDERATADCPIDRLSLLQACDPPIHPRLHLYSLTPDTSIPIRKRHRRDGRQEERALIHALLERVCPSFFDEWKTNTFKRSATVNWTSTVRFQREKASRVALREAFARSVRTEFGLEPFQHLVPALRQFADNELELIAHLRNALAASAIEELKPDLVVYDEFQRFRDLVENSDAKTADDIAAQRVVGRLRGDGLDDPPALLLLSATPYRLFTQRWEEEAGVSHRKEFFELVEFLYGGDSEARCKRRQCEEAFVQLETELRKGQADSDVAKRARARAEELLCPIIARTERASHDDGWDSLDTQTFGASLESRDLSVFKNLTQSFDQRHRGNAVSYWTSIPLPMQTMGTHYVAWKNAKSIPADGVPHLTAVMRDRFERPAEWPHPRLRSFRQLASPERLAIPWLPPTVPWWPLRGVWKDTRRHPSKALVFSRFRAVPQAIAAALSFDVESELLGTEKLSYSDVTRRRLLSATDNRYPLLGLFHPSPLLVQCTEPLAAKSQEFGAIRREVRRQLKRKLSELNVTIRDKAPSLPIWRVLARLDSLAGHWDWISEAWWRLHGQIGTSDSEDAGLAQLLTVWDEEADKGIEAIKPSAFEALVDHAIGAPGVVVGRSLLRHWPEAVSEEGFFDTLEAAWSGLRNYLDQRWFYRLLQRTDESYPDLCRVPWSRVIWKPFSTNISGFTSRLRSLSESGLATELRDGLMIKSGLFFLHPLGNKDGDTFSVRCHAAMPFVQTRVAYLGEDGEKPIRTDELRRAFNTPFWPYVLATTSVGQEGLDFHAWCDTLVHWDLCRNPVDLEQREGRIQRFGGLSIRRAIAGRLADRAFSELRYGESPWTKIETLANQTMSDKSGLAPWWVCKDGGVKRYVFDVPTSEQKHWLHWVKEQRLLYRLALGQPNQEDLVEIMLSRGGVEPEVVRKAVINLSPWFRKSDS